MWPFTPKTQPNPAPEPTAGPKLKKCIVVNKEGNEDVYDLALKLVTTKHGTRIKSGNMSTPLSIYEITGFSYPDNGGIVDVFIGTLMTNCGLWSCISYTLNVRSSDNESSAISFKCEMVDAEEDDPLYSAIRAEEKHNDANEKAARRADVISKLQEALK